MKSEKAPQPPTPASRTPAPAPIVEPSSPAQMAWLQRSAGNSAVTTMLAGGRGAAALQREGETAAPTAHQPPPLSAAALTRANNIRGAASARLLQLAAYNETAGAAIDVYRDKQGQYARRYGEAWGRHNGKITEAGVEAANQNMIEGVIVGVVAGVVIAAAAAAVFPVASAAALGSATWFAFNTATAVAGGVAGAGAMGGIGGPYGISSNPQSNSIGRPNVAGPAGGQRDAEADAWRQVAEVERTARLTGSLAPRFGLELGNAEYAIAQVQAHIDGGTTDMDWDETLNMVSTLANWENSLATFDAQIAEKTAAMAAFQTAVQGWEIPDVPRLEREIWYAWMAGLDDSTDESLDQDTIQRYLTGMGLLPNEIYFSDADQHAAVAAAKAHVASSRAATP